MPVGKGLGIAALPHAEAQMKKRIRVVPHAERRRAAADLEGFAHSAAARGKAQQEQEQTHMMMLMMMMNAKNVWDDTVL